MKTICTLLITILLMFSAVELNAQEKDNLIQDVVISQIAIYTNGYEIQPSNERFRAIQLNSNRHTVIANITEFVNMFNDIDYFEHWKLWEDDIYRSVLNYHDDMFLLYYGEVGNRVVIAHVSATDFVNDDYY